VKTWLKMALAISAIATFDTIIHIESDPKWILWVNNLAYYIFGSYVADILRNKVST